MRRYVLAAAVAAACALPVTASAARAYLTGGTAMFAGPGNDYPIVAQLGPGVAVNVNGCLGDYSWCDVNLGSNRGWVYAGDLAYPYRNQRVTVLDYGPRLALPLITFSLGSYWDHYYRGRPFYRERPQWERHWREHDGGRFDGRHDESGRGRDVRNDRRDGRNAIDRRAGGDRPGNVDRGRVDRGGNVGAGRHEPGNEAGM